MYSVKQIAEKVGITPTTVCNRKTEIEEYICHQDGRRIFYTAEAVDYFRQVKRKPIKRKKTRSKGQKMLIEILNRYGINRPLPYNLHGRWIWNGYFLGRNLSDAKLSLENILIES